MTYQDKLVLDVSDDEQMKELLGTKSAGDACEFTVQVRLDEQTDEQAVFSVNHVNVVQEEEPEEESTAGAGKGAKPYPASKSVPVMMVMAARKK